MSFWIGLVIIVLFLEVIRIGLSSFLLLHILRGIQPLPAAETPEQSSGADRLDWARERDRLASEALLAVRGALDGLRSAEPERAIGPAIAALDAYVLHHVNEGQGRG